MPIIDPKVEEPARQMPGHAIRGELAELAGTIRAADGRGAASTPPLLSVNTSRSRTSGPWLLLPEFPLGDGGPTRSSGRANRNRCVPASFALR